MQIIKTIDLGLCDDTEAVHDAFEIILAFPDFYGRNWDALRDAITGLVEMPTNLILYNYAHFANTYKEDADKLFQIIDHYNKSYEGKSVIQLDYLDGLEKGHVHTLLKRRPFQYGLRGDIQLWDDLEESLNGEPMPDNEENLLHLIRNKTTELTGNSTLNRKNFYIEKYNLGGMSGGIISWEFWEKRGLPLLIGRYRFLKTL